ncbi:MAG: hypothetical protein ABFD07_19630 [Methanobacterium sp.]
MIKIEVNNQDRVSQGDIYRNVEYIESIDEIEGVIEISKIVFPYVIVLTQDCDLAQDFTFRNESKDTQDKLMLSVLVAPLYNVEHVYAGEHLKKIGQKMEPINKKKTPGDNLRKNNNPRYHYLEFPDNVQLVPSVIDFKHYFSVNVKYLYKAKDRNFICKISELYREDISQRFASFLSRIGLPS